MATELKPGMIVGHANPRLADWEGRVSANSAGEWRMRAGAGTDIRVEWTAGSVDGDGRKPLPGGSGWVSATALTVKGGCPVCGRPARYTFPGNAWDQPMGWHHEQ